MSKKEKYEASVFEIGRSVFWNTVAGAIIVTLILELILGLLGISIISNTILSQIINTVTWCLGALWAMSYANSRFIFKKEQTKGIIEKYSIRHCIFIAIVVLFTVLIADGLSVPLTLVDSIITVLGMVVRWVLTSMIIRGYIEKI